MNYVTGDIHGAWDIRKLGGQNFREGRTLTESDNVIILGDFGLLWSDPPGSDETYWLDWLEQRPWTTLVVLGNHENYDLIGQLSEIEMFGGTVKVIRYGMYILQTGQVYDLNGDKVFVLGGGLSIDKAQRIEGKSWWPQEQPSWGEINLAWMNIEAWGVVDYVLSHVAPVNLKAGYLESHKASIEYFDPLEHTLRDMLQVLKFKKHYHGHMHLSVQNHPKHICLYQKIIELGKNLDPNYDEE
jgi:hypothetical protein